MGHAPLQALRDRGPCATPSASTNSGAQGAMPAASQPLGETSSAVHAAAGPLPPHESSDAASARAIAALVLASPPITARCYPGSGAGSAGLSASGFGALAGGAAGGAALASPLFTKSESGALNWYVKPRPMMSAAPL